MTEQELLEYARDIVSGDRAPKKSEVVAAFTTLLAAGSEIQPATLDEGTVSYNFGFEVRVNPSGGFFLPREANRWYTRREAEAFIAYLTQVLESS